LAAENFFFRPAILRLPCLPWRSLLDKNFSARPRKRPGFYLSLTGLARGVCGSLKKH
jgi:hypothetical protein